MEIVPYLIGSDRVVRPANMGSHAPGKGLAVVPARDGTPVAVINVMGSLFMRHADQHVGVVDGLVEEARRRDAGRLSSTSTREATSEKVALARWLDGKVTAVVGTHTHVQTNDARVLPGGTAALSDAGMTGPHDSVIGVQGDLAIRRMRTGLPVRFETAADDVRIEGASSSATSDGRATVVRRPFASPWLSRGGHPDLAGRAGVRRPRLRVPRATSAGRLERVGRGGRRSRVPGGAFRGVGAEAGSRRSRTSTAGSASAASTSTGSTRRSTSAGAGCTRTTRRSS